MRRIAVFMSLVAAALGSFVVANAQAGAAGGGAAEAAHFRTIDVPGADFTQVSAVNDAGTLIGAFRRDGHHFHGFIDRSGSIAVFDPPGSAGTFPSGLNDSGVIVGTFGDRHGNYHGFIRWLNGGYTILNDPAAAPGTTNGESINDSNVVIGYAQDTHSAWHGFVFKDGTFRQLDAPGGGHSAGQGTFLNGINSAGAIAGNYITSGNVSKGFLDMDGHFTSLIAPSAGTSAGQGTAAYGISAHDLLAGWAIKHDVLHGWIWRDGTFRPLNDPNAGSAGGQGTIPFGINQKGEIVVGYYVDSHGNPHGFEARI